MKELITEEQANLIVLWLSLSITILSLGIGFYLNQKNKESERKRVWANTIIAAFWGPAVWVFWQYVYNPIEDFYGLDSLKALEINFFIAIGIGVVFFALFYFVPPWVLRKSPDKRLK